MALEDFRAEDPTFRDVSFPTISAGGPHAALPHYRVGESTDIAIPHGLYLVDSGGQYDEGTTDITRTIAVGETTPEMRDRYTRVLKGHIADRDRGVSRRDDRRADRRLRARAAVGGRRRFRPRHGPRRRRLSLGPRGPAAHRQDRDGRRCSRA